MELKKTWKRAISFVLAFAMAFSFTPSVTSRAAAPEDEVVVDATATDVPEAAEAEEFEVETQTVENRNAVYYKYILGNRAFWVEYPAKSGVKGEANAANPLSNVVFTLDKNSDAGFTDNVYTGVLDDIKIYVTAANAAFSNVNDVTAKFKKANGTWNKTDGSQNTSTVGDGFYVELTAIGDACPAEPLTTTAYDGDVLIINYSLLAAPVDTNRYLIDQASLVADYSIKDGVEKDTTVPAYQNNITFAGAQGNVTVPDLRQLAKSKAYDVDTVAQMEPKVYAYNDDGSKTQVNNAELDYYYFEKSAEPNTPDAAWKAVVGNDETNLQAALDGDDLKAELASKFRKNNKPTEVGTWKVVAVLKKSDAAANPHCATVLHSAEFAVTEVNLTIEPAKDQFKVYGESEGDLAYTAYTYYNAGKQTNKEYYDILTADTAAVNQIKYENGVNKKVNDVYVALAHERDDQLAFIANYDQQVTGGDNVAFADAYRENVQYPTEKLSSANGVDSAAIPLLSRRTVNGEKGNEFWESAGAYTIAANTNNGKVGIYNITVVEGVKFTIKQRPLNERTITYYSDDATVTETDPVKKTTSTTYEKEFKDGTTYYPGIVVKDNIQKPVLNDARDAIKYTDDGRVQYEAVDIVVSGRDSAINKTIAAGNGWAIPAVGEPAQKLDNFDIDGEDSSSAANNHKFTLNGKNNYTGTLEGTWKIGASDTTFIVNAYISSGAATKAASYFTTKDDEGKETPVALDKAEYTVPYTGKNYYLVVDQITQYKVGEDGKPQNLPGNIVPKVTYTDASDAYDVVVGGAIKSYPADDATRTGSKNAIAFRQAGDYKIQYSVQSVGKYTGVEKKEIILHIEKAKFDYAVQDTNLEVGDPDYVVQHKADAANKTKTEGGVVVNGVKGQYTDPENKTQHDITPATETVFFWYSVDAATTAKTGTVDKAVKAQLIDDAKIAEIVEAAHKKAYENTTAMLEKTGEPAQVVGGIFAYKDWVGIDYSKTTSTAAGLAATDEVPEFTFPAVRSWDDDLTDVQKAALMSDDIKALKIATWNNRNYVVDPTPGKAIVSKANIPLSIYVHHATNVDADGNWTDFDIENGQAAQGIAANHWVYGTYDVVGNQVVVYINRRDNRGNKTNNAMFDMIDAVEDLPENLKADLVYYFSGDRQNDLTTLGEEGAVKQADLEAVLNTIAADAYDIEVVLDDAFAKHSSRLLSDEDYNKDNTADNSRVIVARGNLVIESATANSISISEPFPGLKGEVGSTVVKVVGGKTPINEGETTYELKYKVDGSFEFVSAKDVKFLHTGKQNLVVKAVPVESMVESLAESAEKTVEITVKAQKPGDNDVVADVIMSHTKEDGGKTVSVGVKAANTATTLDGSFTKTYGKYTANQKNPNGRVNSADGVFHPEQKDNDVAYEIGLKQYAQNELLYNNGYAVGAQNTGLYWGENATLMRYQDADKTAFVPVDTVNSYNYRDAYDDTYIGADGRIIDRAINDYYEDAQDFAIGEIKYADGFVETHRAIVNPAYNPDTADGKVQPRLILGENGVKPVYNALDGATKANNFVSDGQKLVEDIKLSAELVEDDDKILAYTTMGSGDNVREVPKLEIDANGNLTYTLAKDSEGGKAKVKVTVSRLWYDDIYFFVTIGVDVDGPIISVQSNAINKESSDEVVVNTAFSDKYVNAAPEFTVSIDGEKAEGGKFYYWSKKIYTKKEVADAKTVTAEMWKPLEGESIQTPAEDGEYILYVKAIDDAGNVTYASSKTAFTLDTKAPLIVNSADTTITYTEELSSILLENETDVALVRVTDDALASVETKLGDEAVTITPDDKMNYTLSPSEKTYSIIATDKAGNITTALIDVNLLVDNTANNITLTYDGKTIDVKTLADPADDTKTLFTISKNAGAPTYEDATETKNANGDYETEIAVRGAGTMEDGVLTVTKAGTFAIKMTTAKKGIYGETSVIALLTVNKAKRQVSIKLYEDLAAETKVEKTEFSKTEAADMGRYADLIFDIDCPKPADSVVTFNYFKGTEKLAGAPEVAGDYAVSVAIAEDDLYLATDSLNAPENQKAEYKVVDTKKIKINNDDAKGTVTVTDASGNAIEDLTKLAKDTAVVITVAAKEGFDFTGWTVVSGLELDDATKTEIKATVGDNDIELTTAYVAGIVITKQPASAKIKSEQTATFTVEATGNGEDDLTYQWFKKTGNDAFVEIPGATEASYTTPKQAAANNGDQYKVRVTSKTTGKYKDSEVATIEVSSLTLDGAVITLEKDSVPFNGSTQAPKIVKVMVGDVEVTSQDYEVSTDTYVDAKEYTVTITGKGDYTGTASTKYTITAAEVKVTGLALVNKVYDGNATMTLDTTNMVLEGVAEADKAKVTVELPKTVEVNDKNASKYYKDADTKKWVYAADKTAKIKASDVKFAQDGTNYVLSSEDITVTGTITKKGVTLQDMKFNDKYYDGSKYMVLTSQNGVIKSGLVKGDDVKFTTKQKNYVITGTCSAGSKRRKLTKGLWNITGKDADNYKLAAGPTATGTIKKVVLKSVTLKATSVKCTGKAQKPVIKQILGNTGKKVLQKNCQIKYYRGKKETKDFTTVGTITVEVTGLSNWKGTVKATYKIQ